MNSRLDRYSELNENEKLPSRTAKNQKIYKDLNDFEFSSVRTNSNVKVLDESPREINIEKIKKYIISLNDDIPRRKVNILQEEPTQSFEEPKEVENKVYDINSVLEKAKQGREQDYEQNRYKKLRDTQYDILSKIKIYDKEEKPQFEEEFNTDERTLIDLINTVTIQKEKESLLSELEGSDDTKVTSHIDEESKSSELKREIENQIQTKKEEKDLEDTNTTKDIQINKIDKSFYTNSMSFSKNDFEVFEELEKAVKKNSNLVKIGILFLIILGLATILVIMKFVFNIELF